MADNSNGPEWLDYFMKRPFQAIALIVATGMFFITLRHFLDDVGLIQTRHISIQDVPDIMKYITDSLLMAIATVIIFFVVGVFYTAERGVFGPYMAWITIGVGLVLLIIAAIEPEPSVKLIFSNAGWIAFSAGFGFFAGVNVEKMRRPKTDPNGAPPRDATPLATGTDRANRSER